MSELGRTAAFRTYSEMGKRRADATNTRTGGVARHIPPGKTKPFVPPAPPGRRLAEFHAAATVHPRDVRELS